MYKMLYDLLQINFKNTNKKDKSVFILFLCLIFIFGILSFYLDRTV